MRSICRCRLSSLKASCTTLTPHSGYSYKFCDDGVPTTGGTTPNELGTNAVEVPAKYQATDGDDWTGLPPRALDAVTMPGADTQGNIALDVDISIPTVAPPLGGYPLIVMMHGCCGGNKTGWEATSFDAAGEKWHYSNAWFASRGYVVVTYTARGFVNGSDQGSTGETHLDSRRFEINDYQHLVGLVADDPFFDVDPQKVVTTGGSYGGGFSWLTLVDPFWQSPGGENMKLAATAPKYGWTDLVSALVPTGRHFQNPAELPAFDGTGSSTPTGLPKKSIVAGLYATGTATGISHTTFPSYIDDAVVCLQSTDPIELNPLCTSTLSSTLPSFICDRSAYYQGGPNDECGGNYFSNIAADPSWRVPIFSAATFTDPLFPPVEHRRMANRILSLVPGYPIQQYYGDYQHFVQNKDKEWGDICGTAAPDYSDRHVCSLSDYPGSDVNAAPANRRRTGVTTRLNRFIDHYAQPPGNPSQPQPSFDVTASLQVCPQNAGGQPADEPGDTFTDTSFEHLAQGRFRIEVNGSQTTVSDAEPNAHALNADPVFNDQGPNDRKCPVETTTAGPGVATYDSDPLTTAITMIGATRVSIQYSATSTEGNFQLNSRLYDVFPDNTAVMVDRGVRRVSPTSGTVVYELHGNGWRFEAGHRIRIEIAQDDDPFVKASNVPSSATLTGARLLIPIREIFGHARPKAASPSTVRLVPAFRACENANANHGAPLASPSCFPAVQASTHLTVGSPEGNGKAANSSGQVRFKVVGESPIDPDNGDQADVEITVSLTDVRKRSDLSDYTGELLARMQLRITDYFNGPAGNTPGTVVDDLPFPITVPCSPTGSTSVGGTCALSTSVDAVMSGVAREGKRAIWELGQIEVLDGGPDGDAETADNDLFAVQGLFAP